MIRVETLKQTRADKTPDCEKEGNKNRRKIKRHEKVVLKIAQRLDFVDFQPLSNKNQIMSKFDTKSLTLAFYSVGSYSSYFIA